MSRAAISTSNAAVEWDRRVLALRYKFSKLLDVLPFGIRRQASDFEDKNFRSRFYRDLWSRSAERLGYAYRDMGYGFWAVSNGRGNEVRGRGGSVALDSQVALNLAGNKVVSHRIAQSVPGYRLPAFQEFTLQGIHKARTFLHQQGRPCVVKPARDTGAGAGVVTGVASEAALRKAALSASLKCKDLLIEETIAGSSYRLLFLDGEYIHGVRRDPPRVVGDGRSTVRQLIENANHARCQQGRATQSLFLLEIDQDCMATLKQQGMNLDTRPAHGQTVVVKRVVNQNGARDNVDVTGQVHPSIIETGARASDCLGLQLSGVDVLTTDISLPLEQTGGVINEINGSPGLHHHYLTDQGRDPEIAERLLGYCMASACFPASA
ncbi:hypothetical protein ACXYTJ_10495 [Gilvimarinus sp. F26214L]|uniref:hypothetical protein n=1 Tax=Gilvimarinus sp. DZF01 TaxID=3461371 RepID=UPI004046328E